MTRRANVLTRTPAIAADRHKTVLELASSYGTKVFHTANAILGDPAEAEDLQQDVFLKLLKNLPEDVNSWPGFLVTMTTRLAIDRIRRRNRRRELLKMFGRRDNHPSAEQANVSDQQSRALRAAIGRLSARESEAFCLRYLSDLPIAQIAQLMRLTEGNVGVILHRARERLRERLTQQGILDSQEQQS
jgi:RNA polymerase sigma-70 factor (ECF subfamily)